MSSSSSSCSAENLGNAIESGIANAFYKVGTFVGTKPRITIVIGIVLTVLCGGGFVNWSTENRANKLWVPQNTIAEKETEMYQTYFDSNVRFNTLTVQAASSSKNVLTKDVLLAAMDMHHAIETTESNTTEIKISVDDGDDEKEETNTFTTLCFRAGGACKSTVNGATRGDICNCLVNSILGQWNYDKELLDADEDILATINSGKKEENNELGSGLGNPVFDEEGSVVSAEAFTMNYFLADRLEIIGNREQDPINDAWEGDVFLKIAASVPTSYPTLKVDYFAARSFGDEFGTAITGDLALVNISYVMAFLFLGATMGRMLCGTGSRWTMALAALVTVLLSTAAGFGISSLIGLFFGPVHSLLPFILLGIGVDDAFVIVNAFNRERKGTKRSSESNTALATRTARSLARAGASITVTSATDLVAFAISSSSALPALASFCGFASICIAFLWFFAATFFSGCMVLDERRQRDNRRECLCCLTRKKEIDDEKDVFEEDFLSRYFRNYHAPAILSKTGKLLVLTIFAALFGYGVYGSINLPVEDTERAFIPADSYLQDWIQSSDEYFPDGGIELYFVFENGTDIYNAREEIASFGWRLKGLSNAPPYIAEPTLEGNVMAGYWNYLQKQNEDWPINENEFFSAMGAFLWTTKAGEAYRTDVKFEDTDDASNRLNSTIEAIRIKSEYIRLTKLNGNEIIDDADRQIQAMDTTRELVESWNRDDLKISPYSEKFLSIEGFKVIRKELFLNVGLSIAAVAIIVFATIGSVVAALLITVSVAFCLVEILGFMYLLGIAIDSVSVINIVLAVGLSVDYSAHIGHCFMTKGGDNKDKRATEALADIGAAVLNGATSTFLAVSVLLFSSSYVFSTLSKQFALTVGLGILHGLVLLPVLLSLLGPKPFDSAEKENDPSNNNDGAYSSGDLAAVVKDFDDTSHDDIAETGHGSAISREEDAVIEGKNNAVVVNDDDKKDVEC